MSAIAVADIRISTATQHFFSIPYMQEIISSYTKLLFDIFVRVFFLYGLGTYSSRNTRIGTGAWSSILISLLNLKPKILLCHYVVITRSLLRNDIVSFWFRGYRGEIKTELQAPMV